MVGFCDLVGTGIAPVSNGDQAWAEKKNQENMGMTMVDSARTKKHRGSERSPPVNSGVKRIRALSDTLFLSLWGVSAISGRGKSDKFLSLCL